MKPRSFLMTITAFLLAIILLTTSLRAIQGAESPTRVTVASDSSRASGIFTGIVGLSIDDSGSRIAFHSDSDFFAQGVSNEQAEIWLYDTAAMSLTRVTVASGPGNCYSDVPSLSGDGTKIAFHSNSDFFNQGIPTTTREIWLFDTQSMTLTRVTTSNNHYSTSARLNHDGTRIVFVSNSDFLGGQSTPTQSEIWLYDTTTMTFTRITSATGNGYRYSTRPRLSAGGNRVVFQSTSDFFNQGIPVGSREIWLFDTATMTLTRVTTTTGSASNGAPSMNADGSKIVFHSNSDFLGEGIPIERSEIWLYDTTTMTLTRITTSTAPPPVSFRQSVNPWISGDGTRIVFSSNADFFNPDLSTDQRGIWLYDTETMTFTLVVSAASNGDRRIDYPRTNMDGTRTAFVSDFDLLGQGNIQEDQFEIWLASRVNEPTRVYLPILMKKE